MKSPIKSISIDYLWQKISSRPLVRDTITTTFFSTIGKAIGFLVPFFIAAWFGVTSETDAFFFAYGIILFLSGIFAPVAERIIVPYINEARAKREDIGAFIGRVIAISSIGLVCLTLFFILITKPFFSLITKFDPSTVDFIFVIFLETSPLILLLTWTSILTGALNAHKKFAFPALSPALRALVVLSIVFIFKITWGVHAIAFGYVAGEIVRLAILGGVIRWLKPFKVSLSLQFDNKLWEFLKIASYQTIGMTAAGLNPIVDKTMASWLGKGDVSVLHYADRLYTIPVTFMTTGLMVTLLSHWSSMYYKWGSHRLKEEVNRVVKVAGVLALFIAVLLFFFHQPIVGLAFGRGAFDQARLPEVGWVWVCYLFGFLPYMIGRIYAQAHLVLKNTRVLMISAFCLNGLNIIFNFLLMQILGIAGIALATSFTAVFSLSFLSYVFYRKLEKENRRP
jgi:putative peptidoglycan lipid II flippase